MSINFLQRRQEYIVGKGQSFQWKVLGKLDSHMQKNETVPLPYTVHKIHSKWLKDLNENIGVISLTSILAMLFFFFFWFDSKSKGKKSKDQQVGLHQNKSFCIAKETISIMKRQSTEWEKIFLNHTSDKGLIYKICKGFIQLNGKTNKQKSQTLWLQMGRGTEYTFFQRRHTNSQQVHEKVLDITNHQGNAYQKHNEISSHTC